MAKYNIKKETTLNFSKIRLIGYIEKELKHRHDDDGWLQDIKIISSEDNNYSTSKVFLTYCKSIKVDGQMVGDITYDYVIEGDKGFDNGRVSYPTFEERHFNLIEEKHTIYETKIKELNETK